MPRRSNPPGPLGPTAAHLSASTFMLHTLTSRGVLLSVATSVGILALYAFKKMYHLKTRTRGPVKRAPGMSSLFCASARMLLPAVSPYLRCAERIVAGHERGGLHRIPNAIGYRIHGVDMGNAIEIAARLQRNSIVDSP